MRLIHLLLWIIITTSPSFSQEIVEGKHHDLTNQAALFLKEFNAFTADDFEVKMTQVAANSFEVDCEIIPKHPGHYRICASNIGYKFLAYQKPPPKRVILLISGGGSIIPANGTTPIRVRLRTESLLELPHAATYQIVFVYDVMAIPDQYSIRTRKGKTRLRYYLGDSKTARTIPVRGVLQMVMTNTAAERAITQHPTVEKSKKP